MTRSPKIISSDLDLEAVSDFEVRQDVRDATRRATAEAAGATYCVCTDCGKKRNLNWLGGGCNEVTGEDMCEGVYRAVLPMLVSA